MDVKIFETSLNDLQAVTISSFMEAQTYADLRACLQSCMKKHGSFDAVLVLFRYVPSADRPVAGEKLNKFKQTIEEAYRDRAYQLMFGVGLGEQL